MLLELTDGTKSDTLNSYAKHCRAQAIMTRNAQAIMSVSDLAVFSANAYHCFSFSIRSIAF